jgi:hypothetical protein
MGRLLSYVHNEDEQPNSIYIRCKDFGNDLPKLHTPRVKVVDLQKHKIHDGNNDMCTKPGKPEITRWHEQFP